MLKYKYIFQIKYTEEILSNSTRKLSELPKCSLHLKNKFIALFIIIFRTLSFHIRCLSYLYTWSAADF